MSTAMMVLGEYYAHQEHVPDGLQGVGDLLVRDERAQDAQRLPQPHLRMCMHWMWVNA